MNFVSKENRHLKFLFNCSQSNHVSKNCSHFFKLKQNFLKNHDRYNVFRYEDRDYDRFYTKNDDQIIK